MENWKNMTTVEKVVAALSKFCSVAVIVLVLLQFFGVWRAAGDLYLPLLGILMLVQSYQNRNRGKSVILISICSATLIFVVWAVMLLLR